MKSIVSVWLDEAVDAIDSRLPGATVETKREIISAYLKAAAGDQIARSVLELAETVGGLQDSLRSDHPLQSQTFDGIAGALNNISTVLDDNLRR